MDVWHTILQVQVAWGSQSLCQTLQNSGALSNHNGKCERATRRILVLPCLQSLKLKPLKALSTKCCKGQSVFTPGRNSAFPTLKLSVTQGHIFPPSWRQHQSWESQHLRPPRKNLVSHVRSVIVPVTACLRQSDCYQLFSVDLSALLQMISVVV